MNEHFNPRYYNTIDEIYHCGWTLDSLRRLELLKRSVQTLWPDGHPTKLVQVAGTAGKGSTSSYLEIGLSTVAKSGAYISPELFDFRERFIIGGQPVSQSEVSDAWETVVRPHCLKLALNNEQDAHYFHEANLLTALTIFERHGVEWAAIETAIGGRYDQSTALTAAATVLTNVGADHEDELGGELWQRALDKVGIARRGIPFFTGDRDPAILELLSAVCRDVGAPFRAVNDSEVATVERLLKEVCGGEVPEESILVTHHQKRNVALALQVLQHLFPKLDVRQTLAQCVELRLPGRCSMLEENVCVDIAHNPNKVAALADELERRYPGRNKIIVAGVLARRSPRKVLSPLLKLAKFLIVTGASVGGVSAKKIKSKLDSLGLDVPILAVARPKRALAVARALREKDDLIVLTGDLEIINEAMNPDPHLRAIYATRGWRYRGRARRLRH